MGTPSYRHYRPRWCASFRKHIVLEKAGVKILYGVEANVVDDGVPIAYNDAHEALSEATYVVFDVETTGLSAVYDTIIELAQSKCIKEM